MRGVLSLLIDGLILATVAFIHVRLARFLIPRCGRNPVVALYSAVTAGFVLGFESISGAIPLPWWVLEPVAGGVQLAAFGSAGLWLLYELHRALQRGLAPAQDPARRRIIQAAAGALAGAPLAVLGYGALVQRTDFRVREVMVAVPKLAPDLAGLRLLLLSDIHLSAFLSEAELARVIDASNDLRPHVAFVTGDLISNRADPLDACLRQIARLKTDAGIFGCLGNHEIYAQAEDYAAQHGARLGVRFLRGRAERLQFGAAKLNMVGVDYQPTSTRRHYLAGAERMTAPGALNLLLSHNPDVFPVAAAKGYDVILAGHTHGGQVTVEILDQSISPARFMTPFVYGLYQNGGRALYVTRGIGTIGIPARFGAPPEIALLRLRRA